MSTPVMYTGPTSKLEQTIWDLGCVQNSFVFLGACFFLCEKLGGFGTPLKL